VTAATEAADGVPEEDKALMLAGGYSLYVTGAATKGDVVKRFTWGFAIGTRYNECHSEQDGRDEPGVVVTNNASDFRKLYATQSLHTGLVIIIPSVNRVEQQRLFHGALDELSRFGELINRVLEVDIAGDEITFDFYELPPASNT
jgi:hypothetical protein